MLSSLTILAEADTYCNGQFEQAACIWDKGAQAAHTTRPIPLNQVHILATFALLEAACETCSLLAGFMTNAYSWAHPSSIGN